MLVREPVRGFALVLYVKPGAVTSVPSASPQIAHDRFIALKSPLTFNTSRTVLGAPQLQGQSLPLSVSHSAAARTQGQ